MTKQYKWLNTDSRKFLSRGYLKAEQTPEERYKQIADRAEQLLGISGWAEKFEDYLSRKFYSLSTPVITNFGNKRGLPVSCFGSFVPDDIIEIFDRVGETGVMTKNGGGTSAYFGNLRPRGAKITDNGESSGPVHFMQLFDKVSSVISQGSSRRGAFAAYLPVEHPDIMEFLQIRDTGNPIQEMNFGVTITDKWMQDMLDGNKQNRKIWGRIVQKRFESGYPYIFFTDTVNKNSPQVYKDKSLTINSSNLCSEIALSTDSKNSFVCVLSSLNLEMWDEIVNTDAIEMLIQFLDCVNSEFVEKTNGMKYMEHAHNFAKSQRALGMGVLGWHTLLQSKMVPFESLEAKLMTSEIFKVIRKRSDAASVELAKMFGEPELLKGYGRRNVTTIAIAPTVSSSFILGQTSQGIEPYDSNYYVDESAKGNFTFKNCLLIELLKKYGKDDVETWKSILLHAGSVQHLKFLTQLERDVFKTFGEISQKEIVIQASIRQKYIDQAQSLNLMIPPGTPAKDVSQLLIDGWKLGCKTFYYHKSANPAQELARKILTCSSCEG